MSNDSPLQKVRYDYKPKLPEIFDTDVSRIGISAGNPTESTADQDDLKKLFPYTYGAPVVRFNKEGTPKTDVHLKIGVVLSGGQAPGGHNVIAGIFDAMKQMNSSNELYGFLQGPSGIINGDVIKITDEIMDAYRNTGGFDIIGSGRTKLETESHFEKSLESCRRHGINGIVVIGGDDSNTNGAVLAEWFREKNAGITVVGCPKTIDGDLKNEYIETSFGFDTATKTFSELIGNIEKDANSARKYWHFIRLMGRSASHIALECALQTHPNVCIISEEVKEKNLSLDDVVKSIADVITTRAAKGLNFGVVLIPEGLIEFIPEVGSLISELNNLLAKESKYVSTLKTVESQIEWVNHELSKEASYTYSSLPGSIQRQLLDDRDPHGNVQVSRIETENLLVELVEERLNRMKMKKEYPGKFSALSHFFGYEGRCAFPSNFDADYCYGLGYSAFLLLSSGLTGYISNLSDLDKPAREWIPGGIPLTMMMNMEQRHGKRKPVIKKALVELNEAPFRELASNRERWATETDYQYPGAIQYFGPSEVCDLPTRTLLLEKNAQGSL